MKTAPALTPIAENLWRLAYPLTILGADLRRNVTVIRLASGRLIIHSSGPFSAEDIAEIRALGQPAWLLEGILRHDTYAHEGRAAFPEVEYLAPDGFSEAVGFPTRPVLPPPVEWAPEVLAAELALAPYAREIALLHVPSRTLILTEVVFNFPGDRSLWLGTILSVVLIGSRHFGMSRAVKFTIKDRTAFAASLEKIMAWDFDRIIVGHGDLIETGGKEKLRAAFAAAGF